MSEFEIKTCPICNNKFETNNKSQKYCSKDCVDIANRKIRATYYQNSRVKNHFNCLNCGKDFIVDKYHLKYCSQECRDKHQELSEKPEFIETTCLLCGIKIETKSRTRKYCDDCIDVHIKQRKKEWFQEKDKEQKVIRALNRKEKEQERSRLREQQELERQSKRKELLFNQFKTKNKIPNYIQRAIIRFIEEDKYLESFNLIEQYIKDNNLNYDKREIYELIKSTKEDIFEKIYQYLFSKQEL